MDEQITVQTNGTLLSNEDDPTTRMHLKALCYGREAGNERLPAAGSQVSDVLEKAELQRQKPHQWL